MCDCPDLVKVATTIAPARSLRRYAKAVVLTICDCDRLRCQVNGCDARVDPVRPAKCKNGHRSS